LRVSGAGPLVSLAELQSVKTIGGSLEISGNKTLTEITALDALASLGGELRIELNEQLSLCAVNYLRDRLRSLGVTGTFVSPIGNKICSTTCMGRTCSP
jgi:hypothetical protein